MNTKLLSLFLLTSTFMFYLSGCQNSQENNATDIVSETSVIAKYESNQLTVAELEQSILELSPSQRWTQSDHVSWLNSHIKNHIVHQQLLAEALLIGAQEEPKYKNLVHNMSRNAYAQQYMKNFSQDKEIDEEKIKNYYNENIDKYVMNEKRLVHHIFLNKDKEAQEELASIRERNLNGESFVLLAEQSSESETRHNKGSLGFLQKGDMSEDFDSVVFQLEKNQPSEIISTANGLHIFYVADILPAKSYTIEQVKNSIQSQIFANLGVEVLKEKALMLNVPEVFTIVKPEELMQMNVNSQKRGLVLNVGDYKMTYNQMAFELNELKKETNMIIDHARQMQYIQTIAYSEIIYQHMLQNDIKLIQADQLEIQKNKLLVNEYTKTRITSYLNNKPEIINQYYQSNVMRFATPVRLNLQRLVIPKNGNDNIMSLLESSIESLDNGEMSLDQLAEKYKGKIYNLGWKNTNQLANIDKQILKYAFLLQVNEFSPPFTNESFYSILKLVDKKEPKAQELSQVRQQVVNDYIANNSAGIFSQISQELIADLDINQETIKNYIQQKNRLLN
ncbi:MAG: peptidyl-prolyl cis-trans isomerase [Marinicellaceae bacterium]